MGPREREVNSVHRSRQSLLSHRLTSHESGQRMCSRASASYPYFYVASRSAAVPGRLPVRPTVGGVPGAFLLGGIRLSPLIPPRATGALLVGTRGTLCEGGNRRVTATRRSGASVPGHRQHQGRKRPDRLRVNAYGAAWRGRRGAGAAWRSDEGTTSSGAGTV